jgi:hypothetical protein
VVSTNISGTQTANFTPELWSLDTLDAVEYACVLPRLVNTDFEGEIKSKGDTVHVAHVNNYTVRTKTQGIGNPIEFEAMTHGVTNITVDTHEYAAFQVEKFAERQAQPGYREKQTRKLGYALARGLEVALASLIPTLTTNVVGEYGTELSDNDYLDAWELLATSGAITEGAMNPDVACLLSVGAYAAALRTERFINRDYNGEAGEDALRRAKVGTIYGSDAVMSNLLNAPSAGQHACGFFHKEVFSLARQQRPDVVSDFIIEQLATAVAAHQIYGKARMTRPVETPGSVSANDAFGVLLRTV